jgi:amino acid permease
MDPRNCRAVQQGHLIRVLKRREVLALAFGAMIGWSWVALAGTWLVSAGSPSGLMWPYEWAILLGGAVLGAIFYIWARTTRGGSPGESRSIQES